MSGGEEEGECRTARGVGQRLVRRGAPSPAFWPESARCRGWLVAGGNMNAFSDVTLVDVRQGLRAKGGNYR